MPFIMAIIGSNKLFLSDIFISKSGGQNIFAIFMMFFTTMLRYKGFF